MRKEKLPPHNEPAEHAVLGCILLDPVMTIPLAMGRIKGHEFYDGRHQAIYEAAIDTFEKKGHLDKLLLHKKLKDQNKLESVGGMAFLAALENATPAASSIEHYLEILIETYTLRKLIEVCTTTVKKIQDGETRGVLSELQKSAMEIDPTVGKAEDVSMKELMSRVSDRINSYKTNQDKSRGLITGFSELDAVFNGMRPGQLNILAARPSIGKSSLALNIAENVAEYGDPVGVFSMEMEAEELGERSVSNVAGIDGETIQSGAYSDAQALELCQAIARRGKLPIHICDQGGMTFPYFRTRLRRMVQRHKIKLAVVDYLQLFITPGKENRSIEIGAITTGLKALAKELRIVILCLSQLNRDLEKDNRRPRMSDLRDSGSIEQDADKILLLSEEPKKDDETDTDSVVIIGDIPKNRGGKRGVVRFRFRRNYTRFENISKVADVELSPNW